MNVLAEFIGHDHAAAWRRSQFDIGGHDRSGQKQTEQAKYVFHVIPSIW
jgi:hypothetical protein